VSVKKIKDPIYGYIEIDNELVSKVIDTAVFQRLRNVRQTSYASLYPSSLSNRFVHSLGVYHLGKIVSEAIYNSVTFHKKKSTSLLNTLYNLFSKEEWERYRLLFEWACLLHDVGHAPFSHTGEEFYIGSKSEADIEICDDEISYMTSAEISEMKEYTYQKHLKQLTGDIAFLNAKSPAPHEIMSAIVGISCFGGLFTNNEEKSFFSRCITGLTYAEADKLSHEDYNNMDQVKHREIKKKSLLNCFIKALHSTVIDVDRLDYIIRDAITMGYQSVSIDYKRLLQGVVIILEDDFNFTLGFHESAISIIENAVYAHDNEKKWVQGHPSILYEGYLIQQSIIEINEKLKTDFSNTPASLFSYDSLTEQGSRFGDMNVRLLGDEDILHFMKNVYPCKCSEEYFNRASRRLPVWKSESEYMYLFGSHEQEIISKAIKKMVGEEDAAKRGFVINQESLRVFKEGINEALEYGLENKAKNLRYKMKCFDAILSICRDFKIKEDILFLATNFFKSNFSKGDIRNLQILFSKTGSSRPLKEVSSPLLSTPPSHGRFIYLYYYPRDNGERINAKDFANAIEKALSEL